MSAAAIARIKRAWCECAFEVSGRARIGRAWQDGATGGGRCSQASALPIWPLRWQSVAWMQEADVVALRESILDLLMARFAWRFLGPELVVEANELVRERFLELDRSGVLPIEFADGAVLTGYEVAIDHERSSLGLTPRTDFRPSPRYQPIEVTGDQAIALGFRGKFDLWVARDETRPPNIIARYGEGADDYLSASPEILGLAIVRQIGEPFPEALRRLVLLGLLVDDDGGFDPADPEGRWATPPPVAEPRTRGSPIGWRRLFPWWPRKN